MIHQKTWLLLRSHFPLMVQSKIFESILNNLNTFCKEFYTCTCNITKKLSFLGLKFCIMRPLLSIDYKL